MRMTMRRRGAVAAIAVLSVLALVLAGAALAAGKVKTERASLKTNGTEVSSESDYPTISGNGRFVTFESLGRYVGGDDGMDTDCFVRDLQTDKTTRVSVKSDGKEVPGADSAVCDISTNGRYVAFTSDGALVPADHNDALDVYVGDRQTGKTRRASVMSNGDELMAASQIPSISNDGRYVAFESDGALIATDDNGVFDIYVHDFKTGKTVLASRTAAGGLGDQDSRNPQISNDGRFVTWDSIATFTGDPDFGFAVDDDVWVRDLKRNQTLRASLDSNGAEAEDSLNANSREPSISADGRYVTFEAEFDAPFVDTDLNMRSDIYVKDMKTGKLTRASLKSNGDEVAEDSFEQDEAPADAISADGRFVVWETDGAYAGNDHNDTRDVYMRDMKTKRTTRISLKSNGKEVDVYPNQLASISADGKFVAFVSMAKFTNPDAGTDFDVFVRGPLE